MERAKLVAASLNVSLRNKRMEHSMHDDRGEAAGADYHAIVPINDFPQVRVLLLLLIYAC